MTRWAAGLEYLGTRYAGWQRLPGRDTVQGAVEQALSTVADQAVQGVTAGRTDAGVHAMQQVVHFDSTAARRPESWVFGGNSLLPSDVSLRWVRVVPDDFNARFRAVRRDYRYVIHNHPARSALLGGRATWWPRPLDAGAMQSAAQALIGEPDFSSFRDSQCQSTTPMRRLDRIQVRRQGDFVVVDVQGNAFLHHMVRNIVGTLADVSIASLLIAGVLLACSSDHPPGPPLVELPPGSAPKDSGNSHSLLQEAEQLPVSVWLSRLWNASDCSPLGRLV